MRKPATPTRFSGLLRDPRVAWAAALVLAALTLLCLPANGGQEAVSVLPHAAAGSPR